MSTYETIDLNDYIQTGEGGTAQAYTRKDGKSLAKLYNPGFEADKVPYVYDMAYHTSLPAEALQKIVLLLR